MIANILTIVAGALFIWLSMQMWKRGERVVAGACIAIGVALIVSGAIRQWDASQETQVISSPVPSNMRR